jgi:small-conductance mechanosensitive channel
MPTTSIVRAVAPCLISVLLALAPAASYGAQEPPSAAPGLELASVRVDGETLFKVRGATSLPAQVRAEGIEGRIKAIAEDRSIDPGLLRLEPQGAWIALYAGTTRIVVLTPEDAQVEQLGLPELAQIIQARVRDVIAEYRAARTTERLIRSALLAVGSTLLAAVAAVLLLWLTRRLRRRVERMMRERVQTVGIQSFEILRAERLRAIVAGLLRVLTVAGLAAIVLFWLVYDLRQFPLTRGFAKTLLDSVLAPLTALALGFLDALPNLLFLGILYYAIRGGLRLIRAFFVAVERGGVELSGFEPEWAMPTYKIVRLAIAALGLVVAYPYIPGSDSAAFKGLSLFAGVVFSLGSSSAIANIIAGYMMTYRRAFRVGDRVKIGDATGDVTAMRLQVTHLRTPKNEEVLIPNSQIINSHVINYSTLAEESGLLLHTTVGIGYETPWRQVEAMLLEAARRTAGLASTPEPFVLETALGDFAITYEINVSCNEPSRMPQLYAALHRNILDVFNEYGVAIMTPAYVSDPPDAKLVPTSKWFLPPAAPE